MGTAVIDGAAEAAPQIPFPKAMTAWPRLRQSLLGAFDLCALEARLAQEYEHLEEMEVGELAMERLQWHTHPQARGTIFHAWAARLLRLLSSLDEDALADAVECQHCGQRPNDEDRRDGDTKEHAEGAICPLCGNGILMRVPMTQLAHDMLLDTLRQHDVPDEDVVYVPQAHAKDLEWVTLKFAKEQRFNIANFIDAEDRLEAVLSYPNPHGGEVERVLTGQIDAWFLEALSDGTYHAIVLDWKDSWGIPGATTISRDGYWQQRFYAWLIMKNNPKVSKVTLREVYVRYSGGEEGRDNHREATIWRDRLDLIEAQLAIVVEHFDRAMEAWLDLRAFEAEHEVAELDADDDKAILMRHAVLKRRVRALFSPSPGGHCNYCPLPHRCPIVDEVRVHGTVRNFEDAKRVANELAVINRAKKHREQALRGYLEHERTAAVTVATADEDGKNKLRVYTDKPPGLPEGVPLQTAKGKKAYALVEGTRAAKPDRETMEEMLEHAAKGIPIELGDYYRESSSTTMRLVEEKVPTDEAAALSPDIEVALQRSLERLEAIRAVA